jgi:hypothetical protein
VVRGIGGTMYLTPMPNKLPEGAKFGPAWHSHFEDYDLGLAYVTNQ